MNVNTRLSQPLWERFRWARGGFLAGLLVGVVLGWVFNGIISFLLRFGLVLVLLLPLLVIGWLWWRSSRSGGTNGPGGPGGPVTTVVTWRGDETRARDAGGGLRQDWRSEREPEPFDTIPTEGRVTTPPSGPSRPSQRPVPEDVEAELDALRREQERRR